MEELFEYPFGRQSWACTTCVWLFLVRGFLSRVQLLVLSGLYFLERVEPGNEWCGVCDVLICVAVASPFDGRSALLLPTKVFIDSEQRHADAPSVFVLQIACATCNTDACVGCIRIYFLSALLCWTHTAPHAYLVFLWLLRFRAELVSGGDCHGTHAPSSSSPQGKHLGCCRRHSGVL